MGPQNHLNTAWRTCNHHKGPQGSHLDEGGGQGSAELALGPLPLASTSQLLVLSLSLLPLRPCELLARIASLKPINTRGGLHYETHHHLEKHHSRVELVLHCKGAALPN
jgi:hypothetical protein